MMNLELNWKTNVWTEEDISNSVSRPKKGGLSSREVHFKT